MPQDSAAIALPATWPRCLERLQAELATDVVYTLIMTLQADERDGRLTLYAPNAYVVEELRPHLARISELAAHFAGAPMTVRMDIGTAPQAVAVAPEPSTFGSSGAGASAEFDSDGGSSTLDSHYTFENFVEGRSNQLAKDAARQAAMHPGERSHNPLLLYGGTGLGKTHLMFAAGNALHANRRGARVLYLRSEQFSNAFRKALWDKGGGGMDAFKRQFHGVDALLIDDIQFFAGKDRTQEEFFHTFNALFDSRQQIILTCDRYPREVEGLEPRLKSRLGAGLAVAIEPPDFETRAAIVLAKAHARGLCIPEDAALLMARRLRSNVRDLEGAINSLAARANFAGRSITIEFVQEALRDTLRAQRQAISIGNIKKTVADYFGLQLRMMEAGDRKRSIARPRQFAMALAKELTEHSLPEIGDAFGRDHTTVLHACRQIRKLVDEDHKAREDWDKLMRKLNE